MQRLVSVLTLALGMGLFAYNAMRLGMDASAIRRAQRNEERFAALEAMISNQDASIAVETDLFTSTSSLSNEGRKKAAERLAEAQLVKQQTQLELEDHSSKAEIQRLDYIYAIRARDDAHMQATLILLAVGIALAPTRRVRPVQSAQSAS